MRRRAITVNFRGSLTKSVVIKHQVWARTPLEALRIVDIRSNGQLKSYFDHHPSEKYRVVYGGKNLTEPELFLARDSNELWVIPAAEGDIFGILAGGALIAAGSAVTASTISSILIGLGTSLVIGGIQALFAPEQEESDDAQSSLFSNTPDLVTEGSAVPILYGERIIRDVPVISGYVEVDLKTDSDSGKTISLTTFYLLYLLSQGEIEGFARSPLESVYFNNEPASLLKEPELISTPVLRTGSSNQTPITEGDGRANVYKFGKSHVLVPSPSEGRIAKETEYGGNLSFTIPKKYDTYSDLRLTLRFFTNVLRIEADDGDEQNHIITFDITVSDRDNNTIISDSVTINARTTSGFEFTNKNENTMADFYQLNENGPYRVLIEKTSPDSENDIKGRGNTARLEDDLRLKSYSLEFNSGSLVRYNNYAVCAIGLPSNAFEGNLPEVAFHLKGIKTRDFAQDDTGSFNGALEATPSYNSGLSEPDNPARCTMDLLTNQRYGLGQFLNTDQLDIAAFYDAALYSDQLVNGVRRFILSTYIKNRKTSFDLIKQIGENYRTRFYYAEGVLVPVQDKDRGNATLTLTESDVKQEVESSTIKTPPFRYSSSELSTRHTQAIVAYADREDLYRSAVREVTDDTGGVTRYGVNNKRVEGYGIVTESQAIRKGREVIRKELTQTYTLNFSVGAQGLLFSPGQIIEIIDPLRQETPLEYEIISSSEQRQGIEWEITAVSYNRTAFLDIESGNGYVPDSLIEPPLEFFTTINVIPEVTQSQNDIISITVGDNIAISQSGSLGTDIEAVVLTDIEITATQNIFSVIANTIPLVTRSQNTQPSSPLDYTQLLLWLDAAEINTLIVNSNNRVQGWLNKGTAGGVAASNISDAPSIGGNLNGLNVVRFDYKYLFVDIPINNITHLTFFILFRHSNYELAVPAFARNPADLGVDLDITDNTYYLYTDTGRSAMTDRAGNPITYQNNSYKLAMGDTTSHQLTTTGTYRMYVAGDIGNELFLRFDTGEIAEFIIIPRLLDSEEKDLYYNYLQNKWSV